MLTDSFGRNHTYLRISLTEKCNLRCTYCMPAEGVKLSPKEHIMTAEEIEQLAVLFCQLGVTKIRLTGGEPLVRKDFADIVKRLAKLPVELAITTNAILLHDYLPLLIENKVHKINISLDTLKKDRFERITLRQQFEKTLQNIELALQYPELNIKLNVVLVKNINSDEIIDFIQLTKDKKLTIQFIEFMPFQGNQWDKSKCVTMAEILTMAEQAFGRHEITPVAGEANDTAKYYFVNGFKGKFGIISTVTNPFCDSCNRIRLTANGKIKNCLFSNQETDLLFALRNGQEVKPLILNSILQKKKQLGDIQAFDSQKTSFIADQNRSMILIGG